MLWAKHGLRLQKITLSIGSVWWIIGYFSLFDCWFKGFLLLIEFNWNIFSSQFCFLRPGSVVVNHSPTRSTTKSLGPRPLSVFFLILGDPTVATHNPAERHHKTNLPRTSLIHTQIESPNIKWPTGEICLWEFFENWESLCWRKFGLSVCPEIWRSIPGARKRSSLKPQEFLPPLFLSRTNLGLQFCGNQFRS